MFFPVRQLRNTDGAAGLDRQLGAMRLAEAVTRRETGSEKSTKITSKKVLELAGA